jgi:transposase
MNDKERQTKSLRERIVRYRKRTGASYESIAKQVGVSMFTVMRFANGTVKSVTPLTADHLTEFLDRAESSRAAEEAV